MQASAHQVNGANENGAAASQAGRGRGRKRGRACAECGKKAPLEACSSCGTAYCDEHDSDALVYPINHREGCDGDGDCGCHEERGELPPLCHSCADAAGV